MQPESVRAYVDRLKNTKLSCGKTLLELTTYKDIALWWFADVAFYFYLFNREYTGSIRGTELCHKIETGRLFRALVRRVYYTSDYLLAFVASLILLRFNRIKQIRSLGSEDKVILITGENIEWRTFYAGDRIESILSDQFFHSIIRELNETGKYRLVSTFPLRRPYLSSIQVVISKCKHWDVLHIPFNFFFQHRIGRERNEAKYHFRKVWDLLKDDRTLADLLKVPDDPDGEIQSKIRNYFAYDRPEYVFAEFAKFISMAEVMLENIRPAVIVIEDEYSVFERALIVAAKKKNIPCVAIQHGVIHELHKGYIYQAGEISPDLSVRAPFVPTADVTAVYGQYHKDLLTQAGGYPENAVDVTGQPRYDRMIALAPQSVRSELIERWHLDPSKKIVLWTTQCHSISDSENEMNFQAVFESISSIGNVQLIIKQHPGEPERYDTMIREHLKRYSIDAHIVAKDADTLGLLTVCDLVLLLNSTTGLEAVALQKPLIVVNLGDQPDIVNYVQEGVACGVYKPEDLKPTIEQLLRDDSCLARNREEFIRKYLYRIDGKAAKRVVALIEECVETRGARTTH
ncbi:MAG TPA: UDP-N-acetylglucosamine 2-epimerase [Methanoculleus sp.]|nr:UDP-N-acetylglucosamine 2-epimerase [Methanoculleus sp.]